MHNVDLKHGLKVKSIAEKWRLKSRQHSLNDRRERLKKAIVAIR